MQATKISAYNIYQTVKPWVPWVLLLTYFFFLIGYHLFPDYHDHYRFYAKAVALPGLLVLADGLRETRHHPVFKLAIIYLVYMLASATWSDPFELYRFGQKVTISFYLVIFIAVTHILRTRFPVGFHNLLRISIAAAAVAAIVSLVVFYQTHEFPTARAQGIGTLSNVNRYSCVLGVFALLAMGYLLKIESRLVRTSYVLAILCIICFIWFGQSRTAFVSLSATLFLLALTGKRQNKIVFTVLLALALALLFSIFPDVLEVAKSRVLVRPFIWQAALRDIQHVPVFGHGLISPLNYQIDGINYVTAHNAFLETFWQGGIVGLGVLLLLIGSALWHAYRHGRETGNFTILAILVFCILAMQTSVDTLITRPKDQWMLFWFPLALLISYQARTKSRTDNDTPTSTTVT